MVSLNVESRKLEDFCHRPITYSTIITNVCFDIRKSYIIYVLYQYHYKNWLKPSFQGVVNMAMDRPGPV